MSCAIALVVTALLAAGPAAFAQDASESPGVEVQGRGPVHEAFAQPVDAKPQPGQLAPKEPPEPLKEDLPEQRPEGDNVRWIPGYWAWDAERNDFLWVTGCWRKAPPGQTYVAGYWQQDGDGWRRVPGFWVDGSQSSLVYLPPLPEPPAPALASDEVPDKSPPEDAPDTVYTPGYWLFDQTRFQLLDEPVHEAGGPDGDYWVFSPTRYVWQPGSWVTPQPDMVWEPPHYVWTPGGNIFVPGRWDYPLENRGLMFAPIAFNRPVWRQPGWTFRPQFVINPAPLLGSLFVGPGARHFYFGDYYMRVGKRGGFQPWFAYGPRRFDPLYSYYRFHNRKNPAWAVGLRRLFENRVAGKAPLPPRVLRPGTKGFMLLTHLDRFHSPAFRLAKVTAAERREHFVFAERFHAAERERLKAEARMTGRVPGVKGPGLVGGTLRLTSVAHPFAKSLSRPLPPPKVAMRESVRVGPGGRVQEKKTTTVEKRGPGGRVEEKKTTTVEKRGPGGRVEEKKTTTVEKRGPGGRVEEKKTTTVEKKGPGGRVQEKKTTTVEKRGPGGRVEEKKTTTVEKKGPGGRVQEKKTTTTVEKKGPGGRVQEKKTTTVEKKGRGGSTETKKTTTVEKKGPGGSTEIKKTTTVEKKGPGGRVTEKKTTTVEKKTKSSPPPKAPPATDKKKGHSRGPSAFRIEVAEAGPPAEIRAGHDYRPRPPAALTRPPEVARPNTGPGQSARAPADHWASRWQATFSHQSG
jgi:hypothetical protein